MCRSQVSRAAFGSARSALGSSGLQGGCSTGAALLICPATPPFGKKKNQSAMQDILTRSIAQCYLVRCT